MNDIFVFGTLRHLPLLEIVLGRSPEEITQEAVLSDHRCLCVEGENYPALRHEVGSKAIGLVLTNLTDTEVERLNYYEGPFDYTLKDATVRVGDTIRSVKVYEFLEMARVTDEEWSLDDWINRYSSVTEIAAADIMAMFGRQSSELIDLRMGSIKARASSFERAKVSQPKNSDPRFQPGPDDIQVLEQTIPHAGFFSVEEMSLRHRTFRGSQSEVIRREAFVTVDVVTVLPFDPIRNRVMLVEQFRVGPLARGDTNPWSLEAVAGRIDAGESPEEAALREAREEANLDIRKLVPLSPCYTTPGAVTEYLYPFIGITDLPDGCAGLGGAQDEGEDIRAHLIEMDEFRAFISNGVLENSPLILSGLWLLLNHQQLTSIP